MPFLLRSVPPRVAAPPPPDRCLVYPVLSLPIGATSTSPLLSLLLHQCRSFGSRRKPRQRCEEKLQLHVQRCYSNEGIPARANLRCRCRPTIRAKLLLLEASDDESPPAKSQSDVPPVKFQSAMFFLMRLQPANKSLLDVQRKSLQRWPGKLLRPAKVVQ